MKQLIVDAQLLVLTLVGLLDRNLIGKHKRTQQYTTDDYELVKAILEDHDEVVVTPNILTEVSNLIRLIGDPHKTQLTSLLGTWIGGAETIEEFVSSSQAIARPQFPRLGLTDVGILETVARNIPLLTEDLDLYLAASEEFPDRATNFNHLRTHLNES